MKGLKRIPRIAVDDDKADKGEINEEPEEESDINTYRCPAVWTCRPVCKMGPAAGRDHCSGTGYFFLSLPVLSIKIEKGPCPS